ncbi:MAG: hypothetical protein ACPGVV_01415 [Croceimicrobium sp.]
MKYKKTLMLIFIFVANCLLNSCCPEQAVSQPTEPPYEILWRAPIVNDPYTEFSLSSNPAFYGSTVAITTEYTIQGVEEPLMFFDTASGELTDMWTDYIQGTAGHQHESSSFQDEYLVLSTQRSMDCINLATKSRQWASRIPGNYAFHYIHGSYVYTSKLTGNHQDEILRTPIDEENWQTVFSFTSQNQYRPFFGSFGFGQNLNGDEIMVWKNRSSVGNKSQTDIFAYNLSQDTLMWVNTDFDVFAGVNRLKVDNNRVFGLVQEKAFCLDLSNGETIWTNDFQGVVADPRLAIFDQGIFHLSSDHVILKGDGNELVMLQRGNGQLFKVNDKLPHSFQRSSYFEGKLFFSCGELVILDELTGEILNDPDITERLFGRIESKIVIDPDRRVMYFHNGYELLCVKIPEDL